MERITSTKNPLIQSLRILKNRRERREAQLFIIEGNKMVDEALAAGCSIHSLFIADSADEQAKQLAEKAFCPVYSVSDHVLQAISDTKTPQGIAATVSLFDTSDLSTLGTQIIVLDDVQDPGNVGTILRTADAAGLTGAILSTSACDPFSPKCLRATMGSIFRIPIFIANDLPTTLCHFKSNGFSLIASELSTENFFQRQHVAKCYCLIIGNEGNGISPAVSQIATHHLALPMKGGTESLNAAIAAGIMMYDLAFHS